MLMTAPQEVKPADGQQNDGCGFWNASADLIRKFAIRPDGLESANHGSAGEVGEKVEELHVQLCRRQTGVAQA
ncbi:MAG: hypothetical protein AAB363_08755, partial [Planctomycetota bacterium]